MTITIGTKCAARVIKLMPFGAFVETSAGDQGLLHISDIDWEPVKDIGSALAVGDELELEVVSIEEGRIRFSRKALLPKPAGQEEIEAELRARRESIARTTRFSLSDYDHENERHVEIFVWPDGRLTVSRRIETNADYLADDAPIAEDWEDDHELTFSSEEELVKFCTRLTDELIQACFCLFADGEEVDSDAAKDLIAAALADATFDIDGAATSEPDEAQLNRLLDFPR